jgi:hypothetical protein
MVIPASDPQPHTSMNTQAQLHSSMTMYKGAAEPRAASHPRGMMNQAGYRRKVVCNVRVVQSRRQVRCHAHSSCSLRANSSSSAMLLMLSSKHANRHDDLPTSLAGAAQLWYAVSHVGWQRVWG